MTFISCWALTPGYFDLLRGDRPGRHPRVVVDSAGSVVKVVEYESCGNLAGDSNPAFDLPVGYPGGLADGVTGLVRFGFRDYDPAAGRWTSRDPILLRGGDANLYRHVRNNPVLLIDPSGQEFSQLAHWTRRLAARPSVRSG